jgi:hypothetical protein
MVPHGATLAPPRVWMSVRASCGNGDGRSGRTAASATKRPSSRGEWTEPVAPACATRDCSRASATRTDDQKPPTVSGSGTPLVSPLNVVV